jgi:multidrug efflux pump subunit AcrB
VKTENEEFLIRAKNRNYYADELSNIIIRSDNKGKIVRLSDIATIRDKFSETPLSSSVDGNKAIIITVSSTNDEDLTKSAQQIRNYIDEFNAKNQNLKLTSLQDRSKVLRQRTNLLLENGAIGIFLVLILLSIFLNIRLAFWVAFGLPISFLGMLIFAGQAGVTINLMSLFGMIVVVGILVDDGIVIAENIYQNFEKGKSPAQAAIDGTIEVLPAILSAILTTIIAFGTLLFLDGQVSEFFGEVAIVVILTLMVSLIEALIILPSHLAHSKALVTKRKVNENFISRVFKSMRKINKKGNDLMFWLRDKLYSPILIFALRNRFLSFAGFIAALLLTIGSIGGGIIGVTFFPTVASDIVTVDLNMPKGTNVKITDSIISIIEDKVWIVGAELSEEFMKNDEIIESVILTFVPLGMFKSTVTMSLATVGKKVTPIIPPPIDPIVKSNAAINPAKLKNLFLKANINIGLYNLSLSQNIKSLPFLFIFLIDLNTLLIKFSFTFLLVTSAFE